MWPSHPLHKHFCALLFTVAVVTTYVTIKEKLAKNNKKYVEAQPLIAHVNVSEATQKGGNAKKNKPRLYLKRGVNLKQSSNHTLYILGLFEMTTKWGGLRQEGLSEISAAQLAVEHINRNTLLPGYTLQLLINDTQCDPGVGIDRFFHALYSNRTIIMLLGSGCSNVTERLAYVVPYWNILQVSFGSTSPVLSDRNKFPLFFRTVAPDSSHNLARISFIKYFGWKVVATFSQSENAFLLPLHNFVTELENENITCSSTITFSMENYKEQLKILKDLDTRIIIGSFTTEIAPKIFCEVHHLKMYGKDYVWILKDPGFSWWKNTEECKNLEKVTDGFILFSDYNEMGVNETSISGLTNENFEILLNITGKTSKFIKQTYDAVWAMALTLRETNLFLHNFHYRRRDMTQKFVYKFTNLNFMGVSGPVIFDGADRIGNTIFKQIQGNSLEAVAVYFSENDFFDFNCQGCKEIVWKGGQIPIARRLLKMHLVTIPKYALYPVMAVSFGGIFICFVFFCFNFHFRRMKSVKLSSPRLNNIAVLGCVLVYTSVILLGLGHSAMVSEGQFAKICTIRVYLLSGGFSLAFGSMFAKSYRVHKIFILKGASVVKDRMLKDKQLIALILLPLVIDAVIVGLWVVIDPMLRHLHNLSLQISSKDRGVVYQPQVEICRSHNNSGWFIALYGYKGFLLVMGVYMAWQTRLVKVPALNDSQYIGICVYSAISSAVLVVFSNFLIDYILISYIITSWSILISTTITLVLLFVPLKNVLLKSGSEDPVMQSIGLKFEYNTRRLVSDDPKELLYRVEVQNKVYKSELESLDREIARLEGLLENSRSSSSETPIEEYTISKNIGRASWPSTHRTLITKNSFLSEIKLNYPELTPEKPKIFSKLRKFFGSIPTVFVNSPSHQRQVAYDSGRKPQSTPEVNSGRLVNKSGFVRAKSTTNIPNTNFASCSKY